MKRLTLSLALSLLGFVSVGCGGADGDAGRVETYETTGKITFEGKPVADAVVSYSPKGSQPPALGRTGSDGTYALRTYEDGDGAAAGDYVVLVTKETVTAAPSAAHDPNARTMTSPAAHGGGPNSVSTKSETPAKYNNPNTSGLEATVKDNGENNFDFDLKK
ncbi:MAG: hypothetical protein H0T47_09730 [Planctomycetaceae bacterium]|nr:hypothetical protein [Planctomycetaceae bacterium]